MNKTIVKLLSELVDHQTTLVNEVSKITTANKNINDSLAKSISVMQDIKAVLKLDSDEKATPSVVLGELASSTFSNAILYITSKVDNSTVYNATGKVDTVVIYYPDGIGTLDSEDDITKIFDIYAKLIAGIQDTI